ncbi:unnamed protein product [Larinioides sclopetarius]|uniref:Uncharacterized protein n=1 Tax=Larinioides sclopetarius TaxID=280406 RepID=A0AAV1ZF63_9ARAC
MGDRCGTSNMIILFLIVLFKSLLASNFYHPGSDNKYINYDDCSTSSVAQNINVQGSGDVFIKYGFCNPSVAYSVNNFGSGDTYLSFHDSSYSSTDQQSNSNFNEQWADNIYNQGSGDLHIKYKNCCSSTSTRAQYLNNQGSGDLDVNYGTCSSANSGMAQSIYSRGSGDIRIVYRNCSSLNPVRTVNIVGSGDVIITYADCNSQRPRIDKKGSGRVIIKCRNNRYSRDTRDIHQIQYNRESAPDAAEAGPNSQEVKEEGFPEKRTPKRE